MRYAIFSDLHDSYQGLEQVLSNAQQRQADKLIYLGDVGSDTRLFQALYSHDVLCIFGNWEVSIHPKLPMGLKRWVAEWPAIQIVGMACFCHATPDMPSAAATPVQAAAWLRQGRGWGQLFPRLHVDEEARWQALAALETMQIALAFHGHTHIQEAWSYGNSYGESAQSHEQVSSRPSRWRSKIGPASLALELEAGNRYLVGVGSAGEPLDGPHPRYALYDDVTQTVELCRVSSR